jgi:hypothetical protein
MPTTDRHKEFTLQTLAGTRLKPLGVSPTMADIIHVETMDGVRTTVQRSALRENSALLALYKGGEVQTELPAAILGA